MAKRLVFSRSIAQDRVFSPSHRIHVNFPAMDNRTTDHMVYNAIMSAA